MMVVKFNKFERIAGLFILIAVAGSVFTAISVAVKQGWFEKKFYYSSLFENADGIHPGTTVLMAGLRVGEVEEVELQGDNKIKVNFHVQGKYQNRIREDSLAHLIRPFIIGDRVLEVTVGSDAARPVVEHTQIPSEETIDIMTLISGKKMGNYFSKISGILENLNEVVSALTNKERTRSMVRMFDKLDPLISNLNMMSLEVVQMGREINLILPALNKAHPQMGQDLAVIVRNLNQLTTQFKVLGPAIEGVGEDLPQAAHRMVEALTEATILIKAMQKSMFVRGSVREVHEEEAETNKKRRPSSK